jgi:hypothetical protein
MATMAMLLLKFICRRSVSVFWWTEDAYRRLMFMIFAIAVGSQPVFLVVCIVSRDTLSGRYSISSRAVICRGWVLNRLLWEVRGAVFLCSCGHFVDAPTMVYQKVLNATTGEA